MSESIATHVENCRQWLDGHLPSVLDLAVGCPEELLAAMRYGLLAPGKRLRPVLTILAAEACGGSREAALPAACAVELVHAYSLIHDDLPAMDDDDLRRGQPTCHRKFGEALAILAGDALLTLAFHILTDGYPPRSAAACCRDLASAAGAPGMVGGQAADLAWEGRLPTSTVKSPGIEDLRHVHALKTGALFRTSLRLGAHSAQGEAPGGADPAVLAALDGFGRCFGQAFQITDDLLDVESSEQATGKRVGKDATRGKLTYPGLLGVDESRRLVDEICLEARACLNPLGNAAENLKALTALLLNRDR
jgi:geranylgeranyl diphosphate synthase type II